MAIRFENVQRYLKHGLYPDHVKSKSEKANFRRFSAPFKLEGDNLHYKKKTQNVSVRLHVSSYAVIFIFSDFLSLAARCM